MTRIAVLQMTSGVDPEVNAQVISSAVANAAAGGAAMLFTPEMSGLLDRDRKRAADKIVREADDQVLASVREAAARAGIMVAIGSLAVEREDGRWANRSFVIDAKGEIIARYDKIHMFDVSLDSGEIWNESAAYAAGDAVVTTQTPLGLLGLTICYDVRFPGLYEALGRRKCDAIARRLHRADRPGALGVDAARPRRGSERLGDRCSTGGHARGRQADLGALDGRRSVGRSVARHGRREGRAGLCGYRSGADRIGAQAAAKSCQPAQYNHLAW